MRYFLFYILIIAVPSFSKWTVVIDPGHYQIDHEGRIINAGASGITEDGKRITEYEENLKVAKRLEEIFVKEASDMVGVSLTHDSSTFLGNRERALFSNDLNADLFLRIHMNSSFSKKRRGTETYYYWKGSRRAAEIIHAHLVKFTENDGGIHHHFERGLKYSKAPGVTVELGYLSNPADATRLSDPLYQENLAYALYEGIMNFLRYGKGEIDTFGIAEPVDIALDRYGNLWVVDYSGKILNLSPTGDTLKSISLKDKPTAITCVENNLYIATSKNYIEVYNPHGKSIDMIGELGLHEGQFRDISKITHYRGDLFIAEEGNHRIQVYDIVRGKPLFTFGEWTRYGGRFEDITSVSCYGGIVYVSDFERNVLFLFTPNGKPVSQIPFSSPKYHLSGLSASPEGVFLVAGSEDGDIALLKLVGDRLITLREFEVLKKSLNFPSIAVDNNNIWIADASSERIIKIKTREEIPLYTLIHNAVKENERETLKVEIKTSLTERIIEKIKELYLMPTVSIDIVEYKDHIELEYAFGIRIFSYKNLSIFIEPGISYTRGGLVWQLPSNIKGVCPGLSVGGSFIKVKTLFVGLNIGFDILSLF